MFTAGNAGGIGGAQQLLATDKQKCQRDEGIAIGSGGAGLHDAIECGPELD
jgi:hypothetical protein